MRLEQQAKKLLKKHNGIFTAKQALKEGIKSGALSRMVKAELIERVAPGIYIDPAAFEDEFVVSQARFSSGIFCNETALYLYDMTDTTPNWLEMNFPRGYNSANLKKLRIKAYSQIKSLQDIGITTVDTPYGNKVKAYNIERTLCDIIRPPHIAQDEVVRNAMQAFVRRRDKNLHRLMQYAEILKVKDKMQTYMEVLL